jgi:hypothetical protein
MMPILRLSFLENNHGAIVNGILGRDLLADATTLRDEVRSETERTK